jgi:hypothetical protein
MAAANHGNPPLVSATAYRWTERNVFHAINEDRVPSDKLFDRPHWYAILDAAPVTPGHALLVTKHRAATLLDAAMPPEALADALVDLQVTERLAGCRYVLLLLQRCCRFRGGARWTASLLLPAEAAAGCVGKGSTAAVLTGIKQG